MHLKITAGSILNFGLALVKSIEQVEVSKEGPKDLKVEASYNIMDEHTLDIGNWTHRAHLCFSPGPSPVGASSEYYLVTTSASGPDTEWKHHIAVDLLSEKSVTEAIQTIAQRIAHTLAS